ncbi:MAG TPA: tetratricopeptide repeat protein [Kofleriaceae bacterium]|nr:tetratricopeptide repeat protein [Kofleriaceae bacterium]
MLKTSLVCVVLFTAACGKKAEEKKAPEPTEKIVEKQTKEPTAPVNAKRVEVTTKSPEAKAEYEKGHELATNLRSEEAIEHYKKALELDPEFALAMAELGNVTPGGEGTDLLNKVTPLMSKLDEPQQKLIEAYQGLRAGDPKKAIAALDRVLELAPGQWEADLMIANLSNGRLDDATAIKHLEHALSVNPNLPQAQNGLAYSYANQKNWDKAIAAAKKQVELLPKEPNPADTLGEVEMWAGKFEESEKDFLKATELSANFPPAWQGVMLARAYKGDFKGAYEANAKREQSTTPGVKNEAMLDRAWLQFTENKPEEAAKTLDAAEKDADAKKHPVYAFMAADRAWMQMQQGKFADAAKSNEMMKSRLELLAGDARSGATTRYRVQVLRLAALQGKPAADADKILADAAEDGKRLGDDKVEAATQAYMRGLAAWAKGGAKDGPKAAIAELSKCGEKMIICRYDLALATRKSGDAAGADAIEKQLAATPIRALEGIYVKTHPTK